MDKVRIKSVKGEFSVETSTGGTTKLHIVWDKAHDFIAEVPTEVWHQSPFDKRKTLVYENYAQTLLDAYGPNGTNKALRGTLELVSVESEPVVTQEPKKSKKEKQQ